MIERHHKRGRRDAGISSSDARRQGDRVLGCGAALSEGKASCGLAEPRESRMSTSCLAMRDGEKDVKTAPGKPEEGREGGEGAVSSLRSIQKKKKTKPERKPQKGVGA